MSAAPAARDGEAALPRQQQAFGLLLLVFAPFAWASNIVIGRALNSAVDPDLLNFLRWSGTALCLLPFVAADLRIHRRAIAASFWHLAAAGIVGLGLFQWLVYLSVSHASATHVASALALSPLVALLAARRTGQAMGRLWGGFVLSLAGVLLVQADALGAGLGNAALLGDAIALLAALLWGFYSLLAARLPKTVPPFAALFVMSFVATCFSTLPLLLSGATPSLGGLSSFAWLSVAHLVLVVSVAGLGAYNTGIRRIGAAVGSLFIHLTPVFAVAMAFVFLNEAVLPIDFAGFVLVAGGIAITLDLKKRRGQGGA